MSMTTYRARITRPMPYQSGPGRQRTIPVGPCLVENCSDQSMEIIWGAHGQRCVALPVEEIEAAQAHGHLVLLD